jgi:ribosome-associated translation inhibitor RaiA
MQVQIRHDANLPGDRNEQIRAIVEDVLERYSDQITTVEVHLADEDGPKSADAAIRCSLEVRVEGRKPTAVTHHASDILTAVNQTAEKMLHMLDGELGRLREHRSGL